MTRVGISKRSLRIEKQKVHGMGSPDGLRRTQCVDTACVVFSKACEANFSQYSITDWNSNNYVFPQTTSERSYTSEYDCVYAPRKYVSIQSTASPVSTPSVNRIPRQQHRFRPSASIPPSVSRYMWWAFRVPVQSAEIMSHSIRPLWFSEKSGERVLTTSDRRRHLSIKM